MAVRVFENPANGHREEITGWSSLWAFLFGGFYLLFNGFFAHFLIWVLVALLAATLGPGGVLIAVLILAISYAVAAPGLHASRLLRKGWREVSGQELFEPPRQINDYLASHNANGAASTAAIPLTRPAATSVWFTPTDADWDAAMKECESPERKGGLWARLYSEAQGDESKAKAAYTKHRVQEIANDRGKASLSTEERERQEAWDATPKGECPNCATVVAMSSEACPKCKSIFGPQSSWRIKPIS